MAAKPIHDLIRSLRQTALSDARSVSDGELLQRFVSGRDEKAFEVLAWRHAGMVMGVCRRVLGDAHEAEDAAQATFLILAHKAAAVARHPTVGGWLHKVALRVALRARARRITRIGREQPLEVPPASPDLGPASEAAWREVRAVIDEEVNRLPEKYRLPFVLHHLEGRSSLEVARELGRPVGTVDSWLARARQRLQARLARRGVGPAGVLGALGSRAEWAAIGARAARVALGSFTNGPVAGTSPAVVLANEVLRSFVHARIKFIGVLLVALASGMTGLVAARLSRPVQPPRAERPPRRQAEEPGGIVLGQPTTIAALAGGVSALALSPDGKTLASAGSNFQIKLWDVGTTRERTTLQRPTPRGPVLQAHEWPVHCLAFSPDGKLLASGGADKVIRLWDSATGAQRAVLTGHSLFVQAVAFSPDGKTLAAAAGSHDEKATARFQRDIPYLGELKLWDVATGKERRTLLKDHPGRVLSVAFSADGKTLASSGEDDVVRLWDLENGKARMWAAKDGTRLMALSPDGKTLASVGKENTVKLWDVARQRVRFEFVGHEGAIVSIAFRSDGKALASAGYLPSPQLGRAVAGEVRLWDTGTGRPRAAPVRLNYTPTAVAFSGRSGVLAVGGDRATDGEISLWGSPSR